jgi:hypothetical protein
MNLASVMMRFLPDHKIATDHGQSRHERYCRKNMIDAVRN